MFVKRFVFLFFFIVFSAFLTAQTQKELKEMSYDAIVDSFFVDERYPPHKLHIPYLNLVL